MKQRFLKVILPAFFLMALVCPVMFSCRQESEPDAADSGDAQPRTQGEAASPVLSAEADAQLSVEKLESVSHTAEDDVLGADEEEEDDDEPISIDWGYADLDSMNSPQEAAPLEVLGGLVQEIGNLFEGERKIITITIRNTSDEAWKLSAIDASCSCTNIDGLPGGMMLEPHQEWPMRVIVDGAQITPGEFMRDITLIPRDFKRVRVQIHGNVQRFVETLPRSRRLEFGGIDDPARPWEADIIVTGLEGLKDTMKLGLPKEEDELIALALEELEPGSWRVVATPRKPLPYASQFTRLVRLPIVEPEGYPDVRLEVAGRSGMTLKFQPAMAKITEDDFIRNNGEKTVSAQVGFDPKVPLPSSGGHMRKVETHEIKLREEYASNVDWKAFYEAAELELPPGVSCEKVFTRFGVRFDFTFSRAAFTDGGPLKISLEAYGQHVADFQVALIPSQDDAGAEKGQ